MFVLVVGALAACYGLLAHRLLARRGFVVLKGPEGIRRARSELAAIKNGKRTTLGVRVLSCEDGIWQDVVRACVEQVDAVALDVTEPTENLLWELRTLHGRLPPESILLACESGDDLRPALPASVLRWLEDTLGPDLLRRHPLMLYPADARGNSQTYGHRQELATRLAGCICATAKKRTPEDPRSPAAVTPRPA